MIATWHFKIVFNGEFFSVEALLHGFIKKNTIFYLETLRNIKLKDNLLCLFYAMFLCPSMVLNNVTFGYMMKVMTS